MCLPILEPNLQSFGTHVRAKLFCKCFPSWTVWSSATLLETQFRSQNRELNSLVLFIRFDEDFQLLLCRFKPRQLEFLSIPWTKACIHLWEHIET